MAYIVNRYDPILLRRLDKFGINKFSHSRLAGWIECPGAELVRLAGGSRDAPGPSAAVGNSFECGAMTGAAIPDMDIEECVEGGLKQLRNETALMPDEAREKILRQTAERIRTGVTELRKLGPAAMADEWVPFSNAWEHQVHGSYEPEWSPVPIEWWADGVFPDAPGGAVMVDTKAPVSSTKARSSWLRQGALYSAGTNYQFRILAVMPDVTRGPNKGPKFEWTTLENPAAHLEIYKHAIGSLCRVLMLSEDIHEIAAYFAPDLDHYRLSGPRTQQSTKDLFGYSKVEKGE